MFEQDIYGLTAKLRNIPQNKRSGALNYVLTKIATESLTEMNYDTLNSIIGVLDSAKTEFQRRLVGPYEDIKIEENGDMPIYAAIRGYPRVQTNAGNTPANNGEAKPRAIRLASLDRSGQGRASQQYEGPTEPSGTD